MGRGPGSVYDNNFMLVWSSSQRKQIFWQVLLVRIRRWQSHSWQREFEKLWECYGNKIRRVLSRMDKHREGMVRLRKAMAASSFFSYQNREWWRGEASSAAEKKRRTSINFGQQPPPPPTNWPLVPYCLKTASISWLCPRLSAWF